MPWMQRPRREDYSSPPVPVDDKPRKSVLWILSNIKTFLAAGRGVYRVFNAAGYRFYRSSIGPPQPGDSPFATSTTLPNTPTTTFADGTWYISMSYFNGVIDSGFLPLGPHGETYITLELSGALAVPTRPTAPNNARLAVLAGGVTQILAFYLAIPDGANAADTWAIAYTTDGSTPANNTPTITQAMTAGPLQILARNLPAQTGGTTVKVQLQTRKGAGNYSLPAAVLSAVALTAGPSAPLGA